MPEIIPYLLKVNLAIVLFYLGYRLLLRKLTFYSLNRYYLLFALLFSFSYPLVDVAQWFAAPVEELSGEVVYIIPDWEQVPTEAFSGWPYLIATMLLGALWFVGRLIVRLLSLRRIHRHSQPDTWQWFHYRRVFEPMKPFSFWRNIYVNVERHPDNELKEIFRHEQVHVSELHTLDVLVAELCSILCWFNPGMWLLRYAVRENLEFITDRNVLKSGVDKKAYQYSLVGIGRQESAHPAIAQGFDFKNLKRRIMMMNKERSPRYQLSRYLLAIPAIAVLALVFTMTRASDAVSAQVSLETYADVEAVEGVAADPAIEQVAGDTTDAKGMQGDGEVRTEGTIVRISRNKIPGKDAPLLVLDGNELDESFELESIDPSSIASISVLKDATATTAYGEKGANGVVVITTKAHAGQDTTKRNSAADDRLREVVVTGYSTSKQSGDVSDKVDGAGLDEVVVTGYAKKATADTEAGSGATTEPGEIVVVGYKPEPSEPSAKINKALNDALVVIDGEETSSEALQALPVDDIESINVLKGDAAINKYGEKGAKGVLEVITKR